MSRTRVGISAFLQLLIFTAFVHAQEPTLEPLKGPNAMHIEGRRAYGTTLEKQLEQLADDVQLKRFAVSREKLSKDRYRPIFHYTSPDVGRMNDPNGLCHWKGNFHLFYQAFPEGHQQNGKRIVWGHAYSPDMVRWRDLPYAIYPDKEHNCYSGSTLVEKDRVIAMYFGTGVGMMIATANDPLLLNWHKWPENPVIPGRGAPSPLKDPFLWKEDDGYYYSLAGVSRDSGDFRGPLDSRRIAPELYRSKDLKKWEYLGCLVDKNEKLVPYGNDSACPYFWPIGDKHILLFFSHATGGQYLLGDYDKKAHRFRPYYHGKLNQGVMSRGVFHAPSATPDGKGGVYVIFNVNPGLAGASRERGWDQMMSLGAHLTLNREKLLTIKPIQAIDSLRRTEGAVDISDMTLPANQEVVLDKVKGNAIEIEAEIDPQNAREIRFELLRSPDKREHTTFRLIPNGGINHRVRGRSKYDGINDTLVLDASNSSLSPKVMGRMPEVAEFDLKKGETLKVRIFIDKSIVEIFANDRQWMLRRVYPTLPESVGVSIKAHGNDAKIKSLKAWQMKSIFETGRNEAGPRGG